MAAKVWTGLEPRTSYLRRLSVVFSNELRLKIVTELSMREMSPTGFYREFGGGRHRVAKSFEALERHGWLRFIRSEAGRRGNDERFYRTTELAIFDTETWALLPYSIRVAFSWKSFKQLSDKVREAMWAGTFDSRSDRHLSWTQLLLDQQGWDRVMATVDDLFRSLFEEQTDAKLRMSRSEEKPMSAAVVLTAFESPIRTSQRRGPRLVEADDPPMVPFPRRLSKVFASEVLLQIVAELNLRDMSPSQFCKEFGGDRASTWRRFKLLTEIGWVKRTKTKRRRNATEYLYRATGPAIFDNDTWDEVPKAIKAAYSWTAFEQFSEKAREAMKAGTFDAHEDRYLTWSLLSLDQQGWKNVIDGIEALFALIIGEQSAAKKRLARSKEEPILMTTGLAAFEPSGNAEKEA